MGTHTHTKIIHETDKRVKMVHNITWVIMSIQKTFSVSAKMRGCLQHKGATRKRKKKKGVKKKKEEEEQVRLFCLAARRNGPSHRACNSFLTRQLIVWERLFCSFICVKMGFSYSLWTQKAIVWKPNRKNNNNNKSVLNKRMKEECCSCRPTIWKWRGQSAAPEGDGKKKKREVVVRPYVYIYW